jgi:hypothetical protein
LGAEADLYGKGGKTGLLDTAVKAAVELGQLLETVISSHQTMRSW